MALAMAQRLCVLSMRKSVESFQMFLIDHFRKELRGSDAMRGIVRTSIHAARFRVVMEQVEGCRIAHYLGLFLLGLLGGDFLQWLRTFRYEFMQIDVSIRTVVRAYAASDAPVFND